MNVSAKFNGRYYFSHHCAALFLNYNEVCKDIFLCQWSRNVHNRSLETERPAIMLCESESRIDLSQYTCVPACQQLSSTIWLPSGYKHTHTHTLLSLPKSLWVFCLCLLGPHLGPQRAPSLCTAWHGTAPDLTDLLKLRPACRDVLLQLTNISGTIGLFCWVVFYPGTGAVENYPCVVYLSRSLSTDDDWCTDTIE